MPMHKTIFFKRPKFLAATSNLRAEQSLVHLGRFLHFSQTAKVVGVILNHGTLKRSKGPLQISWK